MRVKELIERLQHIDPDLPVVIPGFGCQGGEFTVIHSIVVKPLYDASHGVWMTHDGQPERSTVDVLVLE
jgi:hypothetical protein